MGFANKSSALRMVFAAVLCSSCTGGGDKLSFNGNALQTPDSPSVNLPSSNDTVSGSFEATGSCVDGSSISIANASLDLNPTTGFCSSGSYSIPLTFTSSGVNGTTQILIVTQTNNGFTSPPISVSVQVNTSAPTVVLSAPTATGLTNVSPISITATFNEAISGLTTSSFNVSNAVVSSLAGGPVVYTLSLTPSAQGSFSIQLPSNSVQDSLSNSNTISNSLSWTYDSIAPTVAITSAISNPTNETAIPITITFSKAVTGLSANSFVVGNGTMGALDGGPTVYTSTVTANVSGAVTVDLASGQAQDAAGNGNTAATEFSITYTPSSPCTAEVYAFDSNGSGSASLTHGNLSDDSDHTWSINNNSWHTSGSWSSAGTLTLTTTCAQDITAITLSNSNLTSIPAFTKMSSMQTLALSHNSLSSIASSTFADDIALQTLDLSYNSLTSLSARTFSTNTALTSIDLSINQLSSLSLYTFAHDTALTSINLTGNQLSSLNPNLFANNTALTSVFLSSNQLSTVPSTIFENNTNLQTVDLSANLFSSLDPNLFANNAVLTSVALESCQLTSLSGSIFSHSPLLDIIYLYDNQLTSNSVDNIIEIVDATSILSGGDLALQEQDPAAPPSSASLNAENDLISRDWSVTTDSSCVMNNGYYESNSDECYSDSGCTQPVDSCNCSGSCSSSSSSSSLTCSEVGQYFTPDGGASCYSDSGCSQSVDPCNCNGSCSSSSSSSSSCPTGTVDDGLGGCFDASSCNSDIYSWDVVNLVCYDAHSYYFAGDTCSSTNAAVDISGCVANLAPCGGAPPYSPGNANGYDACNGSALSCYPAQFSPYYWSNSGGCFSDSGCSQSTDPCDCTNSCGSD